MMWKGIIYKEWLKTRWLILGLAVLSLMLLSYVFIRLGRVLKPVEMVRIWDAIINRHSMLYGEIKYVPIVWGVLLALAQFIPEMNKKCLKLTLHLPISQRLSYFSMQAYGLGILCFGLLVQLLILYVHCSYYFAEEIVANTFLTILPWCSAGIVAYIFTALVCLEPRWIRRVFYLFIGLGVLSVFFISSFPGAYTYVLYLLLAVPIYLFVFPWLSVERFKKGMQ